MGVYEDNIIPIKISHLARLKAYKTYDQLSFHTKRVIDALRFVESYEVKDVLDLTRYSLSTFCNIGQMTRYRYLYTYGKELQKDCPVQVNTCELAQNRDKMIYHTSLAGLGVLGLLDVGISGLTYGGLRACSPALDLWSLATAGTQEHCL